MRGHFLRSQCGDCPPPGCPPPLVGGAEGSGGRSSTGLAPPCLPGRKGRCPEPLGSLRVWKVRRKGRVCWQACVAGASRDHSCAERLCRVWGAGGLGGDRSGWSQGGRQGSLLSLGVGRSPLPRGSPAASGRRGRQSPLSSGFLSPLSRGALGAVLHPSLRVSR